MTMFVLEVANDHAGLERGVPVVAVEALLVAVDPRASWWDVGQAGLVLAEPLQRLRNQLRTGAFVYHRDDLAVGGGVELEVDRPQPYSARRPRSEGPRTPPAASAAIGS